MTMQDALVKGYAAQASAVIAADGTYTAIRSTRAGQLFTADWKNELILAGLGFGVTIGGLAAGDAEALITGGGAGTVIDSDQPEMQIGTPTGHYHIPLGFMFSGRCDLDADLETAEVLLFADTTQQGARPIAASSTVKTPMNLLGGGESSVSYATSAVTADITNPVCSHILAFRTLLLGAVAAGSVAADLSVTWEPSFPIILKGPCAVYACWGGTAALAGACAYYWAEVPLSRFV
jgi:hypothetical protein